MISAGDPSPFHLKTSSLQLWEAKCQTHDVRFWDQKLMWATPGCRTKQNAAAPKLAWEARCQHHKPLSNAMTKKPVSQSPNPSQGAARSKMPQHTLRNLGLITGYDFFYSTPSARQSSSSDLRSRGSQWTPRKPRSASISRTISKRSSTCTQLSKDACCWCQS